MGRRTAERFAAEGAKVVFTGRNQDRGLAVERAIKEAGGEAVFVRCDITNEADVRSAVSSAVTTFGKLTCLVNNAGGTEHQTGDSKIDGRVADVTSEAWDLVMNTDLKGAWLACKYAIPEMISAGKGSIVNVSSFAADICVVGCSAYSAAKSGLHALTRSAAIEYAEEGIRANCVRIGLVPNWQTTFFEEPAWAQALKAIQPLRMGREDDLANAAAFLCSDESSYITGAVLDVDGGLTKLAYMPVPPDLGGDPDFVRPDV